MPFGQVSAPHNERARAPRRMVARYASRCTGCEVRIEPGEEIYYSGPRASRHVVCPTSRPAAAPMSTPVSTARSANFQPRDPRFVQWLAELIMEQGGIDGAWRNYCELNEFWDGEQDIVRSARREFFEAVPDALEQNSLIHPEWAL